MAKAYRESGHHFGTTRSVHTRFLLTRLLKCGVCGANFATWAVALVVGYSQGPAESPARTGFCARIHDGVREITLPK